MHNLPLQIQSSSTLDHSSLNPHIINLSSLRLFGITVDAQFKECEFTVATSFFTHPRPSFRSSPRYSSLIACRLQRSLFPPQYFFFVQCIPPRDLSICLVLANGKKASSDATKRFRYCLIGRRRSRMLTDQQSSVASFWFLQCSLQYWKLLIGNCCHFSSA